MASFIILTLTAKTQNNNYKKITSSIYVEIHSFVYISVSLIKIRGLIFKKKVKDKPLKTKRESERECWKSNYY